MAGEDIIAMTQEEFKRLHIIRRALDKHITQIEAARLCQLIPGTHNT
ncbi:MAG: hypothetical protein WC616_02825 [Candidatus Omnitrophota bacterium]